MIDAGDYGHQPIKIWLVLVVGALALSSTLLTLDKGVTGFIVYDMGPDVELNPDYIGNEEYYSNTLTGVSLAFVFVILQVGVYYGVNRYFDKEEEKENEI